MRRSFIDEYGVEHRPPPPVRPYSSRPAVIVRVVLGITLAGMTLMLLEFADRIADSDPEKSMTKARLEVPDLWSTVFDRFVAPAVGQARTGDQSAVGELFFAGDPFVASEPEISQVEWGYTASTPSERIEFNIDRWRWISSPRDEPILDLVIEWDRTALADSLVIACSTPKWSWSRSCSSSRWSPSSPCAG